MTVSIDDQLDIRGANDTLSNNSADYAARHHAVSVKRQIYLYTVPILCSLCAAAVVANLVVLVVGRMIKSAHNCSTTIIFTRGLAAADCWTSILIALGLVINSYYPYVKGINISLCISVAIESLRLGAITTSVLFLLAIAINHRVITGRAHRSDTNWLNPKMTWVIIIAMWVVPPVGFLIGFSSIEGGAFRSNGTCQANAILKGLPLRMLLFLLTALPLLVLISIYIQIVVRLRNMDSRFSGGSALSKPSTDNRATAAARRLQSALAAKNRRRMVTTALLITCSFFIGWMPGSLYFLLSCDICPFFYLNLPPAVAIAAGIVITVPMILKGIINPAIYAQRIPEFREAFSTLRRRTSSYSYNTILSKTSINSASNPFRMSLRKRRRSTQAKLDASVTQLTQDADNSVIATNAKPLINRDVFHGNETQENSDHCIGPIGKSNNANFEPVSFNSLNDQFL